jgi:N-acetylneuraminic acid mutarotase
VTNSAPISIAELYDPYTGAFAQAGSLNQSRYFHNSTLLPNGQVLIMAGLNSATGFLNSSELYDPTTSTFSSIAGVLNNIGVYDFQSTLLPDGKILVTGGVGPSYFGGVVNTSYIFDPSNNSITTTGNMTSARALHSSTFLPNGKVLVFGGGSNLATSEVFQ